MGADPGLPRWAQYHHKGPYWGGRRVRVRAREGDVTVEGGLRGIPEDATQLSLKTVG